MTIKEKLEQEIARLEEVKASLIRKEQFLISTNTSFMYSTESISGLKGTQGSTPNNLSSILEVVVETINDYVKYISELPFAESNVIYRERPSVDMAILSDGRALFHPPMTWTLMGDDYGFPSVYPQLALSEYYGSIQKIEITATPSFRKYGESGEDISFEIKMIKLNLRRNESSIFRSGTGPLSILLSEDFIYPDDIFIVGIVPNVLIDSSVIYYRDFTYKMVVYSHDGTSETIIKSVGDTRIGNGSISSDTAPGMMIAWDLVCINKMDLSITNSIGDTGTIPTDIEGPINSGLFDGNIVKSIHSGQFTADMERFNLSYRENVSWYRQIRDDRFAMYSMDTSEIQSIVFNNVRPIGLVLEEAIDAL